MRHLLWGLHPLMEPLMKKLKNMVSDFWLIFLLFTASVRVRKPEPPLVLGVFYSELRMKENDYMKCTIVQYFTKNMLTLQMRCNFVDKKNNKMIDIALCASKNLNNDISFLYTANINLNLNITSQCYLHHCKFFLNFYIFCTT